LKPKRWAAILLLGSLFYSDKISFAQPSGFIDVSSTHWAADSIDWASEHQIINGYTDHTFRPAALVSEAEFLKMLIERQQIEVQRRSDRPWAEPYYAYASEHRWPIASQEQQGESLRISRLTVAELIAAAEGRGDRGNEAVQNLLDPGISKGKAEATIAGYEGSAFLSRAEAVSFLHRLAEPQPPKQAIKQTTPSFLSDTIGFSQLPEYTFEVPSYKEESKFVADAYVYVMKERFKIEVTGQAPSKSYRAEKIPEILKDLSQTHTDYFYTPQSTTLFPYSFTGMGVIVQVLKAEIPGDFDFSNLLYQHLAYGLEPAADRVGDYIIVVEPDTNLPGYGAFNIYKKVNQSPDLSSIYQEFIESIRP